MKHEDFVKTTAQEAAKKIAETAKKFAADKKHMEGFSQSEKNDYFVKNGQKVSPNN